MMASVRRPLIAWIHLAVLWSFAFAKPLFDVLADSPEFFVARGNTSSDILLLAFGVTLVPPTLMLAVELLLWRFESIRNAVHLGFVAVLAAASALQVLAAVDVSSALLIPVALLLGALGALFYARGRVVPTVLTVLAPVPLLFLVLLVVFSPVSDLVFPDSEESVAQAAVKGHTPIVFIVFDEFSVAGLMDAEHRIDATRYPNFARLAGDSTWYRNATTVADATVLAVPPILAGRRPDADALPVAADYPNNLFTLLGESYSFDVDESATDLCPPRLCTPTRPPAATRLSSLVSDLSLVSAHLLLPDDLSEDLPAVDRTFSGFGEEGGKQPSARSQFLGGLGDILKGRDKTFASFVDRIRPTRARPRAHFLHVQLPHIPWEYMPDGRQYTLDADMPLAGNGPWKGDSSLTHLGMQRYLLQLGYVDRLIGLLLDHLRETGLYRDSLMVVTADHGVAFQPDLPRRTVDRGTFAQIAGVPLFIKAPGQRDGRVEDAPARSIDILPTVADELDIRMPWPVEGRSLLTPAGGDVRSLSVASKDGPSAVRASLDEHIAGLDAAVERMVRLFGADDGGRGLFAVGPDRDLLGSGVDRLPAFRGQRAEVDFASAGSLRSIGRSSGDTAVVEGRITGDVAEGERVAIAVGGRIRAVTRTYRSHDQVHFWAVLPGGSYGKGSNQIGVFGIHGQGGERRLASFRTPSAEQLSTQDGRTVIVTAFGKRTEVEPGAVNGSVDRVVSLAGNALIVQGWAANTDAGRAADRVLVFADGRLVASGAPDKDRPDVADAYDGNVARSGFQLTLAAAGRSERLARRSRLRVFALEGNHASELKIANEPEIVD